MTHFYPGPQDSPPPWMSSLTRPAFIRVSDEDWAEYRAALEEAEPERDGEAGDGTP